MERELSETMPKVLIADELSPPPYRRQALDENRSR
jgi:hypothetical protein